MAKPVHKVAKRYEPKLTDLLTKIELNNLPTRKAAQYAKIRENNAGKAEEFFMMVGSELVIIKIGISR
jgi:hypothetical protein